MNSYDLCAMRGKVIKSTGSWYIVRDDSNRVVACRLAGHFRTRNIKNTNPISVGDWVDFEDEADNKGYIIELEKRKNYIIRKSVNLSKRAHIIAANLDQSFLIIALVPPKTQLGFVDRFLATSEAYDIPTHIIVNKCDLHTDEEEADLEYVRAVYERAGYPVHIVSTLTGEGIENLKAILKGQTTLVSGNSGVGKSSLINALDPGFTLRTKEVSKQHLQGQHTTTFAELFELSFGAEIIDTPGIKSFGLLDMEKEEISDYFPEIFELSKECKFHNCLHLEEPGCAVVKAYEENQLAPSRYESYRRMLASEEDQGPYRLDEFN